MCYKHTVYILFIHSCLPHFWGRLFFTNSFMNEKNIYKVYGHLNVTNGKWYVGSTKLNPKKRWQNGRGYKNQPKMWNDIQNSDWNADWIHTIFNTFYNKEDALNYESLLIAMLDSVENGYNVSAYDSHSCKHSEDTKRKISEAKIGEKHPMFGKHFSAEHKKKIAESMGVNGVLQFSKDGEFVAEYPSIRGASRQTGCNQSSICLCCKGKRKTCGGYIWMYAS